MNSRQVWEEVGVGRVRWRWSASQLTRTKCVKFLVGGWFRWERERRSQRGVVRREIDEDFKRFGVGAGHVFAVFQYETDTCICMCNAETRASYVLKSGGNLREEVFWAGTKEKMGEGDVFVCVVSLLSSFFSDPACMKTQACTELKIVARSSLLLQKRSGT